MIRPSLLLSVSLVATPALGAPTGDWATGNWAIEPILQEGDVLPGIGTIRTLGSVSVSDQGDWMCWVFLEELPPDERAVLLLNGQVVATEGEPLPEVPAAFLSKVRNFELRSPSSWVEAVTYIENLPEGQVGGMRVNGEFITLHGDPVASPQYPPGSSWFRFDRSSINGSETVGFLGLVAEPGLFVNGTFAIVGRLVPQADGSYVDEIIARRGDALTKADQTTSTFEFAINSSGTHALAEDGTIAWTARILDGDVESTAICIEDQIVAQEGDPSPLPGRNYASFFNTKLDYRSDGPHLAFIARLDGPFQSSSVLIVNGRVKYQQDELAPTGFPIGDFSGSTVAIADNGNVMWRASTVEPSGNETNLFVGDDLVVKTNGTEVGGQKFTNLASSSSSHRFAMSSSGERVIFTGIREDGREGIYVAALEPSVLPVASCAGNLASLTLPQGGPNLGEALELRFDSNEPGQAFAFLGTAPGGFLGGGGCGLALPGVGEVLVDASQVQLLPLGALGDFPESLFLEIPDAPEFLGAAVDIQALLIDLSGAASQPVFLTDAAIVELGSL